MQPSPNPKATATTSLTTRAIRRPETEGAVETETAATETTKTIVEDKEVEAVESAAGEITTKTMIAPLPTLNSHLSNPRTQLRPTPHPLTQSPKPPGPPWGLMILM